MNKATIVSLDKKWAYVFTNECVLQKVAVNPGMSLGQEIELPERDAAGAAHADGRPAKRYRLQPALIALSLILLVSLGVWFGLSPLVQPAYATMSIDVNPSLQLELDSDLVVTAVKPMNEDARQLLSGVQLKGMDWKTAVNRWCEQLGQHYTADLILVSAVMPSYEYRLREQLIQLENTALPGIPESAMVRTLFSYNQEVRTAARENNLSVGRQMLYNQARARHMNYDEEDIRGSGLGELVRELLRTGEHDQSQTTVARKTGRTTETIDSRETNRETERETQRETSGEGSGETTAAKATQRETERETERETQRETNGTAAGENEGTEAAGRETQRETNRETYSEVAEITETADTGTQATHQETHRETKAESASAE